MSRWHVALLVLVIANLALLGEADAQRKARRYRAEKNVATRKVPRDERKAKTRPLRQEQRRNALMRRDMRRQGTGLNRGELAVELRSGTHMVGLPGTKARVTIEPGTKLDVGLTLSKDGKQVETLAVRFNKEVRIDGALPLAAELKSQMTRGKRASLWTRFASKMLGGSVRVTELVFSRETRPDGTSVLRPTIRGRAGALGITRPIDSFRMVQALLPPSSIRALAAQLGLEKGGEGMSSARENPGKLSSADATALLKSVLTIPGSAKATVDAEIDPGALGLPAGDKVKVRGDINLRGSDKGAEVEDSTVEVRGGGLKGTFNISGTVEKE